MVRRLFGLLVFLAGVALLNAADPASARLSAGTRLGRLETARGVFEDVVVKSLTTRTLTFTHKGGLASLPLKELAPELQALAGYDPQAAEAEEAAQTRARVDAETRRAGQKKQQGVRQQKDHQARYETVIQSFSREPELRQEVDLRPYFFQLELGIKSQGRRPSCAVFAVVGAVEYLNAEQTGHAEKFSEEYLIWATMRTVRRKPVELAEGQESEDVRKQDAGFALEEVVEALRGYGIPLLASMPNTMGRRIEDIAEPPASVVQDARARRRVYVNAIPGRDAVTVIGNMVHVLNAGIPIPVGMRWPNFRSIYRSGYLSEQKPVAGYAHAVTLVGYRCPTGKLEDLVFLFRNSYGTDWGSGGYGQVTSRYLERNMLRAVLVEVATPAEAKP